MPMTAHKEAGRRHATPDPRMHARLESLRERHAALDAQLGELTRHPSVSDREIVDVKRRKLQLKDEISRLDAPR